MNDNIIYDEITGEMKKARKKRFLQLPDQADEFKISVGLEPAIIEKSPAFVRFRDISYFARHPNGTITIISLVNGKVIDAEDEDRKIYDRLLAYAGGMD